MRKGFFLPFFFTDGNGTFYLPQRGLRFVGEFSQGRPSGQGTIVDASGNVVQPFGPWGESVSLSPPAADPASTFLRNFDLSSNKYANLIRMIGGWVSELFK
jgi:hypothetical protein